MSQEQPRRPVEDEQQKGGSQYGDIYLELAAEKAADSAVQSPVGLKLISSDHFSNKETDHLGNKETTEHSERRVVFELGGGQVLYLVVIFFFAHAQKISTDYSLYIYCSISFVILPLIC